MSHRYSGPEAYVLQKVLAQGITMNKLEQQWSSVQGFNGIGRKGSYFCIASFYVKNTPVEVFIPWNAEPELYHVTVRGKASDQAIGSFLEQLALRLFPVLTCGIRPTKPADEGNVCVDRRRWYKGRLAWTKRRRMAQHCK